MSRPTLSAAAARHCKAQTETGQAETSQGGGQSKKLLERPQVPSRDSYLEKVKMSPPVGATQAAAARSSPGREDSSVIEGSLKTHQAAPGEGKSVHLNMNVSSLSRQSVDLQTVDRLHVSDAAAGGGDALNAHSKGLNSTVGLNSTADSTVDHSERQLLQLQQQHGTVQSHPLTQGGPAQISGGGDAVGVLQQNGTVQSRTDLTDHTDHGRQSVNERQSDQNLSPVSPLGDAEYDAHLRLSAGQRVQPVQQSLPASPLGPLRGDRHLRLRSRSSMGDAVTAPESEDKSNGLPSPSSGRSADAQSVPVQDRTARYSTVRYSKVPQGVTDSTPESIGSGRDSEESVSGGGGGRVDTDRTVPLTSDVSDESEPTCKTSLVPAVGTNGIAGQSVASSHGSRNALGQEVAAEPVAGSSGGQWVTKPRPPACYAEQGVTTAERGQSAATKSVQRVVAGVPRACPELSATVVKEPAAHVKPGDERQTSGGIIPTDLTPSGSIGVDGQPVRGNTTLATTTTSRRELTAAELPKQAEAERLQKRAIVEEKSKLLEEQIEGLRRGAAANGVDGGKDEAERLLSPTDILEQERLLQQAAQAMKDREVAEYGLRRRQVNTEEQDQLARALAESQADAEEQRLAQEEERRVIQAAIDETGLDAEVRKADEDKVTAAVLESRRNADTLEAVETAEAIQYTWNEDPETVVQMQAQVAGLPTQDTEVFKENVERSGMEEFSTPSNGDCFYHVVEDNTEGSAVSLGMTADGLRKHSAAEAMKRGEIDQEEADRRSVQGQLVAGEEIQSMATTLGCRMVIYHARPAPGEPDKDTIEPEGRAAVRDICMVLRSAHYTVLSDPDCYQRKMTTRQRRQRQAEQVEMEAAEPRVGQETEVPVTTEAEATVLTEAELLAQMAADEVETGTEARKTGGTIPWFVQKPTRRQPAPEIGPPNVWTRIVPKRGYTQVRCVATGAPLEPRRLTLDEMESLAGGSPRHSGFPMRAVPARAAGFGYSRESDYKKLTRRQRDTATQFTHQFEVVDISRHTPPVVGVTTQPKGTGRAQGVEQVGSSGVPRGTTDGGEVHPFNQAALQMRSAERSRKAKAENELARQRRRGYGSITDEELYGSSTDEESCGSSTDSTATTYQHTASLPGGSDVRQGLRRGAATWAMKEVGQDPDEEFNGSPAQQMVQEHVESDAAEADETDDQGIGGRGLVWWFNSWQHWQEDKDRKLSGCTDFDAMYFARTQRVCLGGAWGCVLAWMQGTMCDTRAVRMLRSTFRLASATRGRRTRTPGVTLFSGADAQQMAGNMSHSCSGAGSGTGGGAAKQTGSATMGRPTPEEEAAADQHGNGDNTSAVRRVMNQTELGLAQSQAVLIMHKLMGRLTNLVTTSLGSDTGSEEVAMIAGEPEEHHRMLVTVRDQAAGLARSEFQRISFGTPGTGHEARQPEAQNTGSAGTSGTESMRGAEMFEAAHALAGLVEEQTRVETEVEQAAARAEDEEQTRFETEVEQVAAHAKNIMKRRTVGKWEECLKEAVKVKTIGDKAEAERALLSLGIPERHWRQLGVREKLDKGEWVIVNVNVLGTHQHFVLLKPKEKTLSKRHGHVVLKAEANGLCAFTAALQIARSADAQVLQEDANEPVDERTKEEFAMLNRGRCIEGGRQFAALMQVRSLHEHITAHMHREERAAQEKASQLGRKVDRQSDWSDGSSRVSQQRQQAISAPRNGMSPDTRGDHTSEGIQEALKAETEFHTQMFERIQEEYRTQAVCYGTWIPAWAAAFQETVHMYEISPVQSEWNEAADQFPETVFDMLDDTRKLEQAEQKSGCRPKVERGVARTTSQEWYAGKFARRRRVDAAKAEAEVDVLTDDALGDGLGGGYSSASPIYECERGCGFENRDRGLVEMHEQVCGRTFKEQEQAFESTQCVRNASCSKPKGHGGACKVDQKGARGDNVTEDVAATEVEATVDANETEQMDRGQADPLLPTNLMHSPSLAHPVPSRRGCVISKQEAARTRWKTDVNAKLKELGAGLLRVMCITDQIFAEGKDTFAAVEASLSDETKGILQERTGQLRERKYGTHDYGAMLEWLQNTQHNNRSLSVCTAESSSCACAVCAHEWREEFIIETARSLMNGEDTELAARLRKELSNWKKNRVEGFGNRAKSLEKDSTLFTAVQKADGTRHNMIPDFVDKFDWFTGFGVQIEEIESCCVCGGPAHDAQSGYCQSRPLRYIKECLSGLLGTPEVSQGTGLRIQTTELNGCSWRALIVAGCTQDEGILPLYTACAWGDMGDRIREWSVSHMCLSKEYGFLAQMKEADLAEASAERASVATRDMYMMKELELVLGDNAKAPFSVPISYDLCNEGWITQLVQREARTANKSGRKRNQSTGGKYRGQEIHRVHHDDPGRTFNIGHTGMLTLHVFPEVGRAQSVSYGGVGKNAMEGMHHKGAVINVGELRDSDIDGDMKRLVRTLKAGPQDSLYFDAAAPRVSNSVNPRMDAISTRAPGAHLINGLDMEVERGQFKGELGDYEDVMGVRVVKCSNLGCTEHCTIVLDSDGMPLEVRHKEECMNRVSPDGMRRFRAYNYEKWEHGKLDAWDNSKVWEIEMSNTGNAPSAKDQLRLYALQTAMMDILDEQKLGQLTENGRERTCPDRVDGSDLTSRAVEHLKHIYADVRGDAEGCDETTGRGPKCDVNFVVTRDEGATGLICGDCGSTAERIHRLLPEDGTEVCPDCDRSVHEKNQMIACTQQHCRSRGKRKCRQCCVQSFQTNHYYRYAYQPKGSTLHEWRGCTVEQWEKSGKGTASRRKPPVQVLKEVAMRPIRQAPAPKASNASTDGKARAPTANNTLATMGSVDETTPRSTKYLGTLDERHARAADAAYDPKWEPPEAIRAQYGQKHQILGKCTGMVKAMAQDNQLLGEYGGDEKEYTRNGIDIHLKMRVRSNASTQYAVRSCWLCMPIRKGKVKWKAENFPAEHKDMEMLDEDSGQMKDVVNKDSRFYQFNGRGVCEASGHTGLGFNSTMEAYRGLSDWLIAARKDPDFNKGLPSKVSKSRGVALGRSTQGVYEVYTQFVPGIGIANGLPRGRDASMYQGMVRKPLEEVFE